jgi:hypothetical protein
MTRNDPAQANTTNRLRRTLARLGVIAAVIPAAAAGLMVAAPGANASATGCDNFHNVCISVDGHTGGDVTITAFPKSGGFTGTFTASGPNGYRQTSATRSWSAADTTSWTVHAAAGGEYCVSGYGDGTNQGMACETVS